MYFLYINFVNQIIIIILSVIEDAITKQEIGLLVSTQQVTLVRGTIQSRITEKYEKAFQVKFNHFIYKYSNIVNINF